MFKPVLGHLQKNTFLGILLLASMGCNLSEHSIAPYDTDAQQAQRIENEATMMCLKRRGNEGLPPRPFTTDGCSGSLLPDRTWVSCCVTHDMWYWCGGSCNERKEADEKLRQCVAKKTSPEIGAIVYWGVRLGGLSWFPAPWRWGYGWDWLAEETSRQ